LTLTRSFGLSCSMFPCDDCSWILDAMFATLTNVNFSPARISELIHESQALKMDLRYAVADLPIAHPAISLILFRFQKHASQEILSDLRVWWRS
jgi:hypothetical protein